MPDVEEPEERFDSYYGRWWVVYPSPHSDHSGRTRRSHWVWFHATGKWAPKGMILHHIDENVENGDPSNLQLVTRAEHCKLHRPGDKVSYEDRRRMMLEARKKFRQKYGY